MLVRLCDEKRRDDWEELVENSPDATSGHLWAWREAIGNAYGFEPIYAVVENGRGRPIAAAPFIFIRSRLYGSELTSQPYMDYGGVCHAQGLSASEITESNRAIFDFALELARKIAAKRVQIRSPEPCDSRFVISTEKVTQLLALSSTVEEQMKRLPSERRNRLRHCERFGLTSEVYPSDHEDALLEFCRIYAENMRDLGSPTHSVRFFREICSRLRKWLSLILVRHQGKAIAAAIALNFRGVFSLPWTGAVKASRSVYGSNALYWAGICQGIALGCHTFDFGRSTFGSGIYEFKRRWGPTPQQAYWSTFYLDPRALSPRQRKELNLASKVWRRLPVAITRILGPLLRKGISN